MAEKILEILVVEDDELDRMIIKKALKESGIQHHLIFAEDHESGIEAAKEKEYDCIFLDYNLPGGTGLELLQTIRSAGNTSPIIIVTSQGDEKLAVEAMKLGADDYIPKNLLTGDGLAQSIRYMINLKEQEKRGHELENQLKEAQKQLSTVIDNAPIILFSLDDQANFRLFEGKGLINLGFDKEKIIRQNLNDINDFLINMDDFLLAMEGKEHTEIVEWKNRFFEIFYSPILDGLKNIKGVLGIASDISVHKQAEEEMKKAKQIAEETGIIKEQFLANMSHEIRTPMNGIVGLTRILLSTTLSNEQLKYLQSIKICSDQLLIIINDILDFSKIEAGKMNFESVTFRIDELANQTIELFQSKADEKSLNLILENDLNIPEYICGDPTRLSQILNNLVSNSIKFTEKGEVRLRLKLDSTQKDSVNIRFEVRDTGIGISEKSLPTIFDSFTQASSDTTRKFGGTGLGLTIVKKLINLQNGEIRVKSKPGSGTTFTFSLPFEVSDIKKAKVESESPDEQDLSHLRILVAEDNNVNQMVVKKVLEDWKIHVKIADNGLIALEMFSKFDYDLILMDIQMPEMDGYTAVKKIRTEFSEPKCTIPIMAMTAHASSIENKKCLEAGMDGYISKPFEPADLKKKIMELTKSINPSLKEIDTDIIQEIKSGLNQKNNLLPNHHGEKSSSPLYPIENHIGRIEPSQVIETKINLSYLKRISEGNESFVIEMIEMFLNKTPVALQQMNECFKNQNWEELRKIVHRIKPSFAYVGLKDIQATLAKIETWNDTAGDKNTVEKLLNEIATGSNRAFEQLKEELTSLK